MFCVYKITELSTGKIYIGQCKTAAFRARRSTHMCRNDGCTKLWLTVRGYLDRGLDPYRYFKTEIIVSNIPNQHMAWFAEEYLIKYYDTINTGFNTVKGGKNSGVIGHKFPMESRKRMVDTNRDLGHYIRTPEQRAKTSAGLKRYYRGKRARNAISVVDLTTNITYSSLKDAALAIGCRDSDISNQLKGRQKTIKGHKFEKIE